MHLPAMQYSQWLFLLHDVFMYIEMIMLHPDLLKVLHAQRYIDGIMHSLYSLSK